MQEIL
jgi:hypothetical protein